MCTQFQPKNRKERDHCGDVSTSEGGGSEDNFKLYLAGIRECEMWSVAQNGVKWWALVNMLMTLRVSRSHNSS
jgi:hypothetical protein